MPVRLDILYYIELQRRFEEICLYVACHDNNFNVYSIKIENLFVDICAYFDALCQTFISEKVASGYKFKNDSSVSKFSDKINGKEYFNIMDYKILISQDYDLSTKAVMLLGYEDNKEYLIEPFKEWKTSDSLSWWQSFTKLKHNRLENVNTATLINTIHALAATYIILTLKNEKYFKGDGVGLGFAGMYDIELYKIFFPKYWRVSSTRIPGLPIFK